MTIREQTTEINSRAVFGTVLVAVFLSNLDLFVVNVALPQIGSDFGGASLGALSWVLNAYAIVFAALLVICGRLADRSGHKRGFLIGIAVFTVGSVLCAVAPGVTLLVVARVVQASGAALLLPTSLALLMAATAPERRAGAVRAWSAAGGVAAALGPVVGGLLVELDWRWIFLVNVPVGVVAIVVGRRVLPESREAEPGPLPDILGAVLLTLAVGTLALSLVQADDWGWGSPQVIGGFVVAAALAVWLLIRSARHASPIIELRLVGAPAFGLATIATLLYSVVFAAILLSGILWAQDVWGYSALRTGLAVAPGPMMVPALAIGAAPLARRLGPGVVAAAGNFLLGGGVAFWLFRLDGTPDYAADYLPGLIMIGIGVGLALPTLFVAATGSLPADRLGTGSGIVTTGRQVGAVIGVALLVGVLGTPATPAAALEAFRDGWTAIVIVAIIAAVTSLFIPRTPAPPSPEAVILPGGVAESDLPASGSAVQDDESAGLAESDVLVGAVEDDSSGSAVQDDESAGVAESDVLVGAVEDDSSGSAAQDDRPVRPEEAEPPSAAEGDQTSGSATEKNNKAEEKVAPDLKAEDRDGVDKGDPMLAEDRT
uniref:MFS transporter n=1 Tax=Paractinoplanes polyasparticus TaxID=2856853 RepID=UPI001C84F24A|nr:MFS transporter [Actinoplanes polyasparticus]